jgi:hypothetical protein
MANDNWDFSAYDMDLSKLEKKAEKQTTDDHFEFDLPEVLSIESEKPKEDSPIKKETIVSQPYDNQSQRAVQRPTEEHPQTIRLKPTPPKKEPTIDNKEIAELVEKLDKLSDMVNGWTKQLEALRDNHKEKLPKGIRASIYRLHEIKNVFVALQTILKSIAREATSDVLLALEENKVPSCCNRTANTLYRQNDRLPEMINDLTEAIDAEDPEARTKAREVKKKVLSIHSDTVTLAETMAQFVQAYPHKHGELALFSRIAIAEDEEKLEEIDRAIMVTDQMIIQVVDAPAMIKALEEKDSKVMTEILSRMIDKRSEKRI